MESSVNETGDFDAYLADSPRFIFLVPVVVVSGIRLLPALLQWPIPRSNLCHTVIVSSKLMRDRSQEQIQNH